MKLIYCLLAILWPVTNAIAQPPGNIKPLSIGDTVPDLILAKLYNPHTTKTTTSNLSAHKGKLIILDFWATSCAPCIKAFPKLDSLQQRYSRQVAIIPVTAQIRQIVQEFFQTRPYLNLPSAIEETKDKPLFQLFPYSIIPHTVWISGAGRVLAITNAENVTAENIETVLKGRTPVMPFKKDILHEGSAGPLIFTQQVKAPMLLSSTITARIEGLSSGFHITFIDGQAAGFYCSNYILPHLYLHAFQKPRAYYYSRTVLEGVKDSLRYIKPSNLAPMLMQQWKTDHLFCYDLVAPLLSRDQQLKLMQRALNEQFGALYGLHGSITKRSKKCLVLSRSASFGMSPAKEKGPSVSYPQKDRFLFRNITFHMLSAHLEEWLGIPVENDTNDPALYNLEISNTLLNPIRQLKDISVLRQWLQANGLELKEETRMIEVLLLEESH